MHAKFIALRAPMLRLGGGWNVGLLDHELSWLCGGHSEFECEWW